MRLQTITLNDLEAETLMGFIGELLDDKSPIDKGTRVVLDSIYQKIDNLETAWEEN
jgi:hypothetical protein